MIRYVATIAVSCGLLSCSKPPPLVGSFTGDAHVQLINSNTNSDVKATVVFTTERKNRGGIDGQYYVMTLDGPPFTTACKMTGLLPAEGDTNPTFGEEGNSCKVSVDGKQIATDLGGFAKLENGSIDVLANGRDVAYHFSGKR